MALFHGIWLWRRKSVAALKMPEDLPFGRRIAGRQRRQRGTVIRQSFRGFAMKQKRWMKSVVKAAAETKCTLPWQRGEMRAAMIAARRAEPAKARLTGS